MSTPSAADAMPKLTLSVDRVRALLDAGGYESAIVVAHGQHDLPVGCNVALEFGDFAASPSFTHFNVDVSHTQELPEGYQLWGKVQAQIADGPLVSSEQLSAGGLDTVRGYLESEVLGDDGAIANIEFRSPDIGTMLQKQMKDETGQGAPRFTTFNEWRMFAFADGGHVSIQRPLPEQLNNFDLWSYGLGSRFKVFNGINGVLVLAVPMTNQTYTRAGDPRFNFRLWGEF